MTSILLYLNSILFKTVFVNRSTNIESPLDFQLPPTNGFLPFYIISSSYSSISEPAGSSHFSAYFPSLNSNLKFLTLSIYSLSTFGIVIGISLTGGGAVINP